MCFYISCNVNNNTAHSSNWPKLSIKLSKANAHSHPENIHTVINVISYFKREGQYLWFFVFGIINFFVVIPIFRLLGLWVFDLLWWQEVPISFKLSTFRFRAINTNFVCIIRFNNEGVQMCEFIILWLRTTTTNLKPHIIEK